MSRDVLKGWIRDVCDKPVDCGIFTRLPRTSLCSQRRLLESVGFGGVFLSGVFLRGVATIVCAALVAGDGREHQGMEAVILNKKAIRNILPKGVFGGVSRPWMVGSVKPRTGVPAKHPFRQNISNPP